MTAEHVKTVLRGLKVGDTCILVDSGYRAKAPVNLTPTTVTAIGRRWMSVEANRNSRFDRDDGLNDSTGNHRDSPRVSTQALLDADERHMVANAKVQAVLMRHGWWTGDKFSTGQLERIAAILEEP